MLKPGVHKEALPVMFTLAIPRIRSMNNESVDMLLAYGVIRVVDVRTVPRSSHNPQFNKTGVAIRVIDRAIEDDKMMAIWICFLVVINVIGL